MAYEFKLTDLSNPDPASWPLLSTTLANLGKPVDPLWTYEAGSSYKLLGDGTRRLMGFPVATWHWNFLNDACREALRAFCSAPAISAPVYIRTLTSETSGGVRTYGNFQAVMFWPPAAEDRQAGNVLGFTLEFHRMVGV